MRALPTASQIFERLPRPLRRHRLMRAWMAATREDSVQLVRIRGEHYGYADVSDGFPRLIVIDGHFEHEFFALADRFLENGGTFFDVGANFGLLRFGLAGVHGAKLDFHLFEPNQRLIAAIRRTSALYPAMRLRLNEVAVGAEDGTVRFSIDERQSGASHISEVPGAAAVPCVALDTYLEKQRIRRVDLLKLDVEGYELAALRGATKALDGKAIAAVYFEYFEKWLVRVGPPRDLIEFLRARGYEVCFYRSGDMSARAGATMRIKEDFPGCVELLPVRAHDMPPMTDLLAVPREALVQGA